MSVCVDKVDLVNYALESRTMATVVAPELKEALLSRGVWADFNHRREDIKAEMGCTTREASVAALEELAPDLADQMRLPGRPRKVKSPPPSQNTPPASSPKPPPENAHGEPAPGFSPPASLPKRSLADAKRVARDSRLGGVSDAPVASRGMFDGKSCSNMQSLIWAVESLAFSDVRPEDAPSALAWSLYSLMMQSPSTKADIAKVTAAKIAQRASAEEESNGRFDGEGEYSMAEAIAREVGE